MEIKKLTHVKNWDRKSCPKCGSLFKVSRLLAHTAVFAENESDLVASLGLERAAVMQSLLGTIEYPQLVPLDDLSQEVEIKCIGCNQVFTKEDFMAYLQHSEEE